VELITLKEVSKEYAKTSILTDVNLAIEEGDIYGIIGKSGSGKTTLLNLITGFIQPSYGQVLYNSKITHRPRDLNINLNKIKRQIGFTPQHNSFYPQLTVKENLIHFGKLYKIPTPTLISNVKNLLEFTGLYNHRNKLAEQLSGGMQKRLDLSCSLVHKPKLLVLDEPTADLDPILQKEIIWLLQEANKQGITIVIASHQLDSIEDVCNKVAIVHKGRVFSQGKIDDIKKPFLNDYFTIRLKAGDSKVKILDALKKLSINKIVDEGNKIIVYPKETDITINGLLDVIKKENLYLHHVDMRKPSLNEIFEHIAGQ